MYSTAFRSRRLTALSHSERVIREGAAANFEGVALLEAPSVPLWHTTEDHGSQAHRLLLGSANSAVSDLDLFPRQVAQPCRHPRRGL